MQFLYKENKVGLESTSELIKVVNAWNTIHRHGVNNSAIDTFRKMLYKFMNKEDIW